MYIQQQVLSLYHLLLVPGQTAHECSQVTTLEGSLLRTLLAQFQQGYMETFYEYRGQEGFFKTTVADWLRTHAFVPTPSRTGELQLCLPDTQRNVLPAEMPLPRTVRQFLFGVTL